MIPDSVSAHPVEFDVWGCRGSRSFSANRSAIGNNTSCYSLLYGEHLLVLDAGRGLAALGHAVGSQARFEKARRIALFVGHAHMDHWEGLKDADWFWQKNGGLELEILGPAEALRSIEQGYAHPSFVPLEVLAEGNLGDLRQRTLGIDERGRALGWDFRTFSLNHYSGSAERKRSLTTLGLRLSPDEGRPVVCYLCDHEPTEATLALEKEVLAGAHLALVDAHFPDIRSHAFGHGSQEYAAGLARAFPDTLILATHHGPALMDDALRESFARHSRSVPNLRLATEGVSFRWDPETGSWGQILHGDILPKDRTPPPMWYDSPAGHEKGEGKRWPRT